MKRLALIVIIISLAPIFILAQTTSFKADKDSVREKQIRDLEFTLTKLLSDRDLNTYANYLADDYIRISANADVKTKEQVLQEFRSTKPMELVPEILQVRIYGNTAVMNIHLKLISHVMEKTIIRESLLTKVFILQNGHWFMVSNTGTPLSQENITK